METASDGRFQLGMVAWPAQVPKTPGVKTR
jgi:hypothetical protein